MVCKIAGQKIEPRNNYERKCTTKLMTAFQKCETTFNRLIWVDVTTHDSCSAAWTVELPDLLDSFR